MAAQTETARRAFPVPRWLITTVVVLGVIVAAGFSTAVRSLEEDGAAGEGTFDSAAFAAERYATEVVPWIEEHAVALPELLDALAAAPDSEAEYGNTSGSSSSYSFPVTATGVAGEANQGLLPITVEGVDGETTVYVQVGPALNGTAIRDVTGTVSFDMFVNQLEYQQVATEFNNQVREAVLGGIDPASLTGATVTVTGAFTRVNPQLVSIVPVAFEVTP